MSDSPSPDEEAVANIAATAYVPPGAVELIAQWSRLIASLSGLLNAPVADSFKPALLQVDTELLRLAENDADRALFLATFLAESETHHYCAAHSLYVALACELAARAIDGWGVAQRATLRCAALSMNISMAAQQDQMAQQAAALSVEQRALVAGHEASGAALLRELGITDDDWLAAVAQHHRSGPGELQSRKPAEQIARLIQRADRLTAGHSIRPGRIARGAAEVSRAAYLDESKAPDDAGAALVKALGIYPPGSAVRLANREAAIVVRRGVRADQPQVAAVIGADGMAHLEPLHRDTGQPATKITASLAKGAIRVPLSLEGLLGLVG